MAPPAGPFVEVPIRSWPELARFFARDLSRSGVFLPMSTLLPRGSALTLVVVAPDGERLELKTVVSAHRRPEQGQKSGLHVSFAALDEPQQTTVSCWLAHAEATADREPRRPRPASQPLEKAPPSVVDAVLQRLQASLQELSSAEPLQAFGLSWPCDVETLEATYQRLVTKHHPHHYARFGSPQVKQLATRVFVQLQKQYRAAHATAMGRPLGQGVVAPVVRGSRAQRAISQSLQMLSLYQYEQALVPLEKALQADPDNPRLLATLHLVQGRRARAQDELEAAKEAYGRLLQVQPDNQEARQALQELEIKLESQGGLFKRMLRTGRG